ncbi:MAG: acetyl-CoA C-acyltransferase [Chitinophagaceae bacterium]
MKNRDVFVLSAIRTPIGSFGGVFKNITAPQLGAIAVKHALIKSGLNAIDIQELVMGNVLSANLGQAPAKQVARLAGLPDHIPCTLVNKVCSSGMKAISMAVQSILLGDNDIVIAGGMESMSQVPFYVDSMRWGNKYGNTAMLDGLAKDGLTDAYNGKAMGIAAELCAEKCFIGREQQDEYAKQSYLRAQQAWNDGYFDQEVCPVEVDSKNGVVIITKDEEPWNVKFEKINSLKPAFLEEGTVTAANASTMNDGAAALVLISGEKLKELSLKPIAKLLSYADAEQDPDWFTTTPSLAMPLALKKAGLQSGEIDYWEINEAFSVVAIENAKRMNIDPNKLNIHGGAVSLGHPLGCSGARIAVSLLHILKQKKSRYGCAGICNGGGGASALVVEYYN